MAQPTFLAPFSKLMKQVKARGWKGVLTQLYVIGDIKFGDLKGTDEFGNKYYEDKDLPFGQHRWVEYADIHNPDGAQVHPTWHGWMSHVFDETPDEWNQQFAKLKAAEHSDTIYENHVGLTNDEPEKLDQHTHTMFRQRGYGVGSLKSQPFEKEKYYKQPGHPLSDKSEEGRFKDRKDRDN